jgi:hypothetical protein
MKRIWFSGAVLAMVACFGAQTQGGGDKTAWKPFLSEDAYKVVTNRSIKLIEETAKANDKNAAEKIKVEAAILQGYTLSTKKPAANGEAVQFASRLAVTHANAKFFKALTEFSKIVETPRKFTILPPKVKAPQEGLDELMNIFRNQSKGGEGIHADLQYQPKLKNLNGIEALLGSLAGKKLNEENLGKVSKELPNLAYRIAVVGSLTHGYAPEKDANKWREISVQMRDTSIALAEAAQQKNAEGVQKAAEGLQNSCTQCHREFKNK